MAKINYSKVDAALSDSINKKFIDDLNQLATIAELMRTEKAVKTSEEQIRKLVVHFQKELMRIRKTDPDFFQSLGFSKDHEKRFFSEPAQITANDWAFLKQLKDKIDEWKKTLKKRHISPEDEKSVEEMRTKQKSARFNINPKWTPL